MNNKDRENFSYINTISWIGEYFMYTIHMVSTERMQQIKAIVSKLLDKPLQDVAKDAGISVFTVDLTDSINSWEVSWFIYYDSEKNKYSIYINSTERESRQRFTLAHELWHFYLHKDLLNEDKIIVDTKEAILFRKSESADDIIEQEANAFAVEILMPKELIERARNTTKNIVELCNIFQVSAQAMTYRLKNIGLLADEWLE